jgi:hypothetical protein
VRLSALQALSGWNAVALGVLVELGSAGINFQRSFIG